MPKPHKIQWTDATWNPVVGCDIVSKGCTNCYAMTMAHRLKAMQVAGYGDLTKKVNGNPVWTGRVTFQEHTLLKPTTWQKGRRIFVDSMGDLFHEKVTDQQLDQVFAVMAMTPHHRYQILTKRPERMRAHLTNLQATNGNRLINWHAGIWADGLETSTLLPIKTYSHVPAWPMKNVQIGVSIEDQETASARIPVLLNTPARYRVISAEPLIGPVILQGLLNHCIHQVIVGGESGKGARPMHPMWARSIKAACRAEGVPFFFKQWGEWREIDQDQDVGGDLGPKYIRLGVLGDHTSPKLPYALMKRVGKADAGRELDGLTYDEQPSESENF